MITKRSNHIPMFTMIESTNVAERLVRIFLNQKSCGETTLQVIIHQYAHQYGPNIRLMNAYCCRHLAIPGNEEFSDVCDTNDRARYDDNNVHQLDVIDRDVI